MRGTPIYVKNLGTVQMGGAIRRGLLDMNGEGEAVGGIVVMRYGENAKDVIDRVKEKIVCPGKGAAARREDHGLLRPLRPHRARHRHPEALAGRGIDRRLAGDPGLPAPFPERPGDRAHPADLGADLLHHHEAHGGHLQHHVAGGDRHRHRRAGGCRGHHGGELLPPPLGDAAGGAEGEAAGGDHRFSAKQVGRAIFFSLAIIVLSFVPVFLLEGQEGKLFHPLAFTKTFSMMGSALIAITLVPVLMYYFMRGKMPPESSNPVSTLLHRALFAGDPLGAEVEEDSPSLLNVIALAHRRSPCS